MPAVRVGVDVGGTFTDVVSVTDGRLAVTKAPSTPETPAEGVFDGLARAGGDGAIGGGTTDVGTGSGGTDESLDLRAVDALVHGTTVATNAVLEREWADAGLVTTEGFRDVLEIGRQDRRDLYDPAATKADPVVPRDRRFEVPERLDERGAVREPLDEDAVRGVARELADAGVESVAVSLLFAFEDDAHERRVVEVLAEELDGLAGGAAGVAACEIPITASSDVLPELREYERTLATALNAALLPVMDAYVGRLDAGLRERDCGAPLEVMTSAGGLVGADHARRRPVETLLSGPAAGVQGAAHVAGLRGLEDAITMDMGGTSCDVSLVTGGEPTVTTDRTVGDFEVAVPSVDVHTIGAGGGSIAWLDSGGALRVGPRSAGAEPGPVCYGRGGTEPTVTDAQLLLGRLDPDELLVEDLEADVDAVEAAVAEHLADPMGTDVEDAARGILRVANASMERALRVVSVERGHDPRAFALVAYGGAGPLHAAALAEALEVPRVLIPRTAGALSALGLLATDRLHALSTSMVRPLSAVDPAEVGDVLASLEAEGRERLDAAVGGGGGASGDGSAVGADGADDLVVECVLDCRYVGQASELSVPAPEPCGGGEGDEVDREVLDAVAERFHERHEQRYGHAAPGEPVELVTVRVRVRDPVSAPDLRAPAETAAETAAGAIREERPVAFDDDWLQTRIFERERLPAGAALDGPAVVEGPESTAVVRPGQAATVDQHGTLVLEVEP